MGRIVYQIWFVGAVVWFFDALLSMHQHVLERGLAQAAVAAAFLIAGVLFRRQYIHRLEREQVRKHEHHDLHHHHRHG